MGYESPHLLSPALSLLVSLFLLARIFYRAFHHPLASVPGPRIAIFTSLYRAYYDIIRDGEWSEHLHDLHARYGTVVRVGPNELHFSDPNAFADIYCSGPNHTKDNFMYKCIGSSESVFGLIDFHQAQKRRQALGPLFSRRAILKLEQELQKHVDILISRLAEFEVEQTTADLHLAFRSLTLDIITSYSFGKSFNALQHPGFRHPAVISMGATLDLCWVFKHIPFLRTLIYACPPLITMALMPKIKGSSDKAAQLGRQIDALLDTPVGLQEVEHDTIYHFLITRQGDSKEGLPRISEDKARFKKWLLHEGLNLRIAGSETVGNACTIAAFYVLRDPTLKYKMEKELKDAWPDVDEPLGYEALERLPYLTAVIKESLRLSYGTVTPLPRLVGSSGSIVGGIAVPPGTTIAMGHTIMHRNPALFPDPLRFLPERWLQSDSAMLDRYLVAFSKGPRHCLGINLAWCELYLILGNLFRRLDLKDDGYSSLEDLNFREYLVPLYRGHHLHAHVQKKD